MSKPSVAPYRAAHSPTRQSSFSIVKLIIATFTHVLFSNAHPIVSTLGLASKGEDEPAADVDAGSRWILLGTGVALVLLGGIFAGLTIALMGQDEIYLQVIATSGEGSEKKNAAKVLRLLKRGKHWVLVTLLISNVITNETLPIVLDRSLGGGYVAAIASTVLVIIFGEIVPQSACVRYGLPIGAWTAPFVLALMWLEAPITWPVAKLLDWILGEDHGTTYKKAGLKTLVTLHKTIGTSPTDRLNEDEVKIISSVLDLKAKTIGSIMTPMKDVFTLPADAVLDEEMMKTIMTQGFSRIPVHNPAPGKEEDFVGMLLVKILITYDPEDQQKVGDFALATLPETRPDTSCLDIINFFQEGKSHMVLVSADPGGPTGALGVVTLEDVIEELIGEEIIDESDVYIDVSKAIRRVPLTSMVTERDALSQAGDIAEYTDLEDSKSHDGDQEDIPPVTTPRPSAKSFNFPLNTKPNTFLMRRKSSTEVRALQMTPEMRQTLKNIGPSNVASRPKATRIATVKIKPGLVSSLDARSARTTSPQIHVSTPPIPEAQKNESAGLLSSSTTAKDGVKAVQQGYGTWDSASPWKMRNGVEDRPTTATSVHSHGTQTNLSPVDSRSPKELRSPRPVSRELTGDGKRRSDSQSTLGSMHGGPRNITFAGTPKKPLTARSGSIQEHFVETDNGKKLVLELSSSSEDAEDTRSSTPNKGRTSKSKLHLEAGETTTEGEESHGTSGGGQKSKRRKRGKRRNHRGKGHADGENARLLTTAEH